MGAGAASATLDGGVLACLSVGVGDVVGVAVWVR